MVTHLTAMAWMMSLMLAPHSLALVGNLTGMHQGMFFIWLAPALGLYWLTARSAAALSTGSGPRPSDDLGLVLVTLSSSARWVTTLVLSPLLLVTAGFAFNEIFVFWFPNFAFAFILLGILLAIQLAGRAAIRITQLILMAIVLAGLGTLITMGLGQNAQWASSDASVPAMTASHAPYAIIMLFVGFDLVSNLVPNQEKAQLRTTIDRGLCAAAVVIALWALTSLANVPTEKLSESFIPYLLAARSIGGEAGRMVMGVVVIAGSCAAVNALFVSISQSTARLASQIPSHRFKWLRLMNRPGLWLFSSAIIVAALMGGGFAGSEKIDIYLRAGLIFWLIYYGTVHLAALADAVGLPDQRRHHPFGWAWPAVGAATMISAVVVLLINDANRAELLKFAWIVLMILMLVAWSGRSVKRILGSERNGAGHRPFELN